MIQVGGDADRRSVGYLGLEVDRPRGRGSPPLRTRTTEFWQWIFTSTALNPSPASNEKLPFRSVRSNPSEMSKGPTCSTNALRRGWLSIVTVAVIMAILLPFAAWINGSSVRTTQLQRREGAVRRPVEQPPPVRWKPLLGLSG